MEIAKRLPTGRQDAVLPVLMGWSKAASGLMYSSVHLVLLDIEI
jgi:hypothetical protein